MRERKVWKLFSLLRNTEKLDFKNWLVLEYGEKQQFVQNLYDIFLKHSPSSPKSEEVWEGLYPHLPYDDARLRKLCRDLSRQLEIYLAIKELRENPEDLEIFLLRALNKREATELFFKTSKKLRRKSQEVKARDTSFLRYRFELEIEIQRYLSKYVRNIAEREKFFPNQYAVMLNCFDEWWMEEKLHLALAKPANLDQDLSQEVLLEELLEKIQADEHWDSHDRLQVYVRMYNLIHGDSDQSLYELLRIIKRTEASWHREELANFLTSLINSSIRKLNTSGKEETAQDLYSLFEWGISSRLFFIDNNLPEIIYKNLINICLRVENFDKALNYLENLKVLLPEHRQEECYRFNLGRYHFSRKAFKEVINCFSGQRFSHLFDEIDARTYLLQAQYELSSEEPDWLARQLNTLSRFVKNQELSPQFKLAMRNGLRLFRKLVLAYTPYEYEQVLQSIGNTRPLYRAKWLENKASARAKKRPESNPTS